MLRSIINTSNTTINFKVEVYTGLRRANIDIGISQYYVHVNASWQNESKDKAWYTHGFAIRIAFVNNPGVVRFDPTDMQICMSQSIGFHDR